MQVVPRDRPQIGWVCPSSPKVHPSKENPQCGIKKLNSGTDGHGALKQNVSATRGMREGAHTTPLAGFGMSVQPQVAKCSTGLMIAAARLSAGRVR